MDSNQENYWLCIIGGIQKLPQGADFPLRDAVENAYQEIVNKRAEYVASGWGINSRKLNLLCAIWRLEEKNPLYNKIEELLKMKEKYEKDNSIQSL